MFASRDVPRGEIKGRDVLDAGAISPMLRCDRRAAEPAEAKGIGQAQAQERDVANSGAGSFAQATGLITKNPFTPND